MIERLKINPTTDDRAGMLPNDEDWYLPFWMDVLDVLPPMALVKFVDIHKNNIKYSDKEKREVPQCPVDLALPPAPKSKDSYPPPCIPSVEPTIAVKDVNVGDSNQAPVMVNSSFTVQQRPIVLDSKNQKQVEKALGALQTAVGMTVGGMTGAAVGTIGGITYAAAATGVVVSAPVVLPVIAVGAALGVLGAGVAKLFRLW